MNLRTQLDMLETSEGVTVTKCALYSGRHIFYADGNYYVMCRSELFAQFPTLSHAITGIGEEPEKYPPIKDGIEANSSAS